MHAYLGCPRESRPRPKNRCEQGKLTASSPLEVSWAFTEPPLSTDPLSCGQEACPPCINHAVLGPDQGPPPELWLSPGHTLPQGLGATGSSRGLSLLPVARLPSPVTPSAALS